VIDAGIWVIPAAGGGSAELLWKTEQIDSPELDWSPDGRSIVFSVFDPERGRYALWMLEVASAKASVWLAGDTDASDPRFSPDGRFVAYQARPNGPRGSLLRRRDGSEQWQVTTEGGSGPRFGADGRTLYFVDRKASSKRWRSIWRRPRRSAPAAGSGRSDCRCRASSTSKSRPTEDDSSWTLRRRKPSIRASACCATGNRCEELSRADDPCRVG
jgi:Tol biopolymer transport system component